MEPRGRNQVISANEKKNTLEDFRMTLKWKRANKTETTNERK